MDLNHEYGAHQRTLIGTGPDATREERVARLDGAAGIAGRIGAFRHGLGAAAACVWSQAQFAEPAKP